MGVCPLSLRPKSRTFSEKIVHISVNNFYKKLKGYFQMHMQACNLANYICTFNLTVTQ